MTRKRTYVETTLGRAAGGRGSAAARTLWTVLLLIAATGISRPAAAMTLNGSAAYASGALRLTSAGPHERGSAWSDAKQYVASGFQTAFLFRITAPGNEFGIPQLATVGGDGFAFVIQNDSLHALGGEGGNIGFAGISDSLAVEFDTFQNGDLGDPNGNHISVQTRGTAPNTADEQYSLGSTTAIPKLADGNLHSVTISDLQGTLRVLLDGQLVLAAPVNLSQLLSLDNGTAYVGFTASTGSAWENHDILNWAFIPGLGNVPGTGRPGSDRGSR